MRKRRSAQRPTLADVAALAGVSAITVSRFFNEPQRVAAEPSARIREAVQALHYVPNLAAGGLASAHNRVVAMVVPNISGPIFAQTLQALSDGLSEAGYQLLLASSYFSLEAEERAVRAFLGWRPAALVLTSRFHSPATEALMARAGLPVIETWDLDPQRSTVQIGFSHHEVGQAAARYLLDKGYQRICFVLNSASGDLSAKERYEGYAHTLQAHGRQPMQFVPDSPDPLEAGAQALRQLVQRRRQRPDALILANDNLACGALLAAQRDGVAVPGQMALFGFGDYSFSDKLSPSLSTIRPPAREIGEQTVRQILSLVKTGQADPLTRLHCQTIGRESA